MKSSLRMISALQLLVILLAAANSAVAAPQAPPNDNCADAWTVTEGAYLWSNFNATDSAGAPISCDPDTMVADVWYRYTSSCSGQVRIDLCPFVSPTTQDTVIQVFTAASSCSNLVPLACSGSGPCGQHAAVEFPAVAGQSYLYRVGGVGLASGIPTMVISCIGAAANDLCTTAAVIPTLVAGSLPYTAPPEFSNGLAATNDPDISCNSVTEASASSGLWFTYTATQPGTLQVNEVSSVQANVTLFKGTCTALQEVTCGNNVASAFMSVGDQCWVLVSTRAGLPAVPYIISASWNPAPTNDLCSGAKLLLAEAKTSVTTAGAQNDYQLQLPGPFDGLGHFPLPCVGRDVALRFTPPTSGKYTFKASTANNLEDIVLYLLDSCPTGMSPIVISDAIQASNRTGPGLPEELYAVDLHAGEEVYLIVDTTSFSQAGTGYLIEAFPELVEPGQDSPGAAYVLQPGSSGSMNPAGDVDFYDLGTHPAGSRVFAIVDGGAAGNNDFDLRVTTTTSTLEYDDAGNDTIFGILSPNVAGTPLTGSQAFLRVNYKVGSVLAEPYRIHAVVRLPGESITSEVEPNDDFSQAIGSANGYFSGSISSASDTDFYAMSVEAGDIVFLSLDCDPLRNNTPINGNLALTFLSLPQVAVNDNGTTSSTVPGTGNLAATTPNSPAEALIFRAQVNGTVYARVRAGSAGDYLLSAASFPPTACILDSDMDGTPDCRDACPNDPLKVDPLSCGCGVSEVDSDLDGVADCVDGCPSDPTKSTPGVCGCGVADVDSDLDGASDCIDECPSDPLKQLAGICGCGVPEGCSLVASSTSISLSVGGQQELSVLAGAGNAGKLYLLLGSLSGNTPGIPIGISSVLPLNFDAYFNFTLASPNQPPLIQSFGVLDSAGTATAKIQLAPGLPIAGLPLVANHAYVVIDPIALSVDLASNAAALTLLP